MAHKEFRIGRNITDSADNGAMTALSSSSAVTLTAAAVPGSDDERLYLCVKNTGNLDIWVRLKPAATDNNKEGIFVPRGDKYVLDSNQMYIGETSVIANSGSTASLSYVEF